MWACGCLHETGLVRGGGGGEGRQSTGDQAHERGSSSRMEAPHRSTTSKVFQEKKKLNQNEKNVCVAKRCDPHLAYYGGERENI